METTQKIGLTVENFIDNFRKNVGWECKPNTRISRELTEFAEERLGSTREIDELHMIFCIAHGINPFLASKSKKE